MNFQKPTKNLFIFALFLSLTLLTACSGGGDDSVASNNTGNNPPQAVQGKFVDAPVIGLTYSTATQSGTTDASGFFNYVSGETVTFKIGNITLGSATGGAVITPVDLVSGGTTSNATVLNICRLLLSLDSDANADTITIPSQVLANATTANAQAYINQLDFSNVSTFDSVAANLLSALTSGVGAYGSTPALVDAATAKQHLDISLGGSGGGTGGGGTGGGSTKKWVIQKMVTPIGNNTYQTTTWLYDANGNNTTMTISSSNFNATRTNTFNSNGQVARSVIEYTGSKTTSDYTYDSNGDAVSIIETSTNSSTSFTQTFTFQYDSHHRQTRSETFQNGISQGVISWVNTYNTDDKISNIKEYINGVYSSNTDHTYDSNGLLISQTSTGPNISSNTVTFTNDTNGNMATSSSSFSPNDVTTFTWIEI